MPRTIEHSNEPLMMDQRWVFSNYYPDARINLHTHTHIPENVMNIFEWSSKRFRLPEEYRPLEFEAFYLITHPDSSITYAARQKKLLDPSPNVGPQLRTLEETTQFIDVDTTKGGAIVGRSELRFTHKDDPYFTNKPFEGWSGTEDDYLKQGYARRRIFTMNAFSQTTYGLPLHSDTLFVSGRDKDSGKEIEPQKLLWEKLVNEGIAVKYDEGGKDRFFISFAPTD